jgi:rhodanese-related sulfurtransferase
MGGNKDGRKERSGTVMRLPKEWLTKNRKLGLLLMVLGVGAVILGSPYKGASARIDAVELARIVEREVDHVAPEELADWIIEGKADFRLVDLRSEAEYSAYHIPGAENVPLTALADYGLQRNEKIILYSDGGIHSAQAWFLLTAHGYRGAYILRGGLEEWKDRVLFPSPGPDPTPAEKVQFAKMSEVSRFFGGTPQTGAAAATAAVTRTIPKLEAPAAAPAAGTPPKKKKKEGC